MKRRGEWEWEWEWGAHKIDEARRKAGKGAIGCGGGEEGGEGNQAEAAALGLVLHRLAGCRRCV